jgi:hypothetical protein
MGQCPSGFLPYQGTCVRSCPNRFQFLTENNQPRCAYKGDIRKFVTLTPVTAIPPGPGKPLPTLEQLKIEDPERYAAFDAEIQRVDAEIAGHMKNIDKDEQVKHAFEALQQAEDTRAEAPEAYQMARNTYYTLTKVPEWVEEEKQRIANIDAEPEVQRYKNTFKDAMDRKTAQQRTQDVMQSVKDGVLSLKDDVQYTTKTFQDQIAKLKNQINIERRGRTPTEGEETPFYKWLDTIMNILIVGGLLYAVFILWKKMSRPTAQPMVYAPVAPRVQ